MGIKIDRTTYKPLISRLHDPEFPIIDIEDQRKSDQPQAWNVGCSFAWGMELPEGSEPYPNIVASHFGLDISILSRPGTSIDHAADQILRSDIRAGDLVIWGLTSINRFVWYHDDLAWHINLNYFAELRHLVPKKDFEHLFWMYTDATRIQSAVTSLLQVVNFCEKIGAHLVVTAHLELSEDNARIELKKYLDKISCYVDVYLDPEFQKNLTEPVEYRKHYQLQYCDYGNGVSSLPGLKKRIAHPGPKTHKIWGDYIIDFIKKKGIFDEA
jgi:hypothetical protein